MTSGQLLQAFELRGIAGHVGNGAEQVLYDSERCSETRIAEPKWPYAGSDQHGGLVWLDLVTRKVSRWVECTIGA
jgi:hypothetical protein